MLSRSAERLYWLARYLERTENTARLMNVTMNLIFDLPYGSEVGWHTLLEISGVENEFHATHQEKSEITITHFLLADLNNPSSLFSSLAFARENIRTSRELMPDEAWEQVNELYLYVGKNLDTLADRRGRVVFLQEILRGCQRFTGFMAGAMSHNDSYRFISLGRNIERADMTTRMMDFSSVLLAENRSSILREHESILWINVLKSLNASLMYRKHVRQAIQGQDVLEFLLKNADFPSSVQHCLTEIADCVKKLPHSEALETHIQSVETHLANINMAESSALQLHEIIDILQTEFNRLHQQIAQTWFLNNLAL